MSAATYPVVQPLSAEASVIIEALSVEAPAADPAPQEEEMPSVRPPMFELVLRRPTAAAVARIDPGEAVARPLARLLEAAALRRPAGAAQLQGFTSAGAAALDAAFAGLLGQHPPVHEVALEAALPKPPGPHI